MWLILLLDFLYWYFTNVLGLNTRIAGSNILKCLIILGLSIFLFKYIKLSFPLFALLLSPWTVIILISTLWVVALSLWNILLYFLIVFLIFRSTLFILIWPFYPSWFITSTVCLQIYLILSLHLKHISSKYPKSVSILWLPNKHSSLKQHSFMGSEFTLSS